MALFTVARKLNDRVMVSIDGTVAAISQGYGYDSSGNLVVSSAGSPVAFKGGIGVLASGAVCGTTSTSGSDGYASGVRVSSAGRVVYALAAPTGFSSGNPITATGALACI